MQVIILWVITIWMCKAVIKTHIVLRVVLYFFVIWHFVSPNTGKYGTEITPYLDNFHAVFKTSERKAWKKLITIIRRIFAQTTITGSYTKLNGMKAMKSLSSQSPNLDLPIFYAPVHSTLWKYSVSHFVYIFRMDCNF